MNPEDTEASKTAGSWARVQIACANAISSLVLGYRNNADEIALRMMQAAREKFEAIRAKPEENSKHRFKVVSAPNGVELLLIDTWSETNERTIARFNDPAVGHKACELLNLDHTTEMRNEQIRHGLKTACKNALRCIGADVDLDTRSEEMMKAAVAVMERQVNL